MTCHYILYFVFYFKIYEPLNMALIDFVHFRHREENNS